MSGDPVGLELLLRPTACLLSTLFYAKGFVNGKKNHHIWILIGVSGIRLAFPLMDKSAEVAETIELFSLPATVKLGLFAVAPPRAENYMVAKYDLVRRLAEAPPRTLFE